MYKPEWLPHTLICDFFFLLSEGRGDGYATELKGRWVGWSRVSWGSISLFLLTEVVKEDWTQCDGGDGGDNRARNWNRAVAV